MKSITWLLLMTLLSLASCREDVPLETKRRFVFYGRLTDKETGKGIAGFKVVLKKTSIYDDWKHPGELFDSIAADTFGRFHIRFDKSNHYTYRFKYFVDSSRYEPRLLDWWPLDEDFWGQLPGDSFQNEWSIRPKGILRVKLLNEFPYDTLYNLSVEPDFDFLHRQFGQQILWKDTVCYIPMYERDEYSKFFIKYEKGLVNTTLTQYVDMRGRDSTDYEFRF